MLYILITGACLLQARVDQSYDQCESQFISFIWIFDFSELRDMHSYKIEEDQRFSTEKLSIIHLIVTYMVQIVYIHARAIE